MEGLDPYTGYEDYDPGMGDSDVSDDTSDIGDKASVTTDQDEEPHTTITAHTLDPNRHFEIDLLEDGFSISDKYSTVQTGYGEVPLTAVFYDGRRVSIHPLGIVAKPPGIAGTHWGQMDVDRLFTPAYDSALVKEEELTFAESDEIKELPQVAGSGGSGGEGEPPEKEKRDPTEMPFLDHLEEFRWALLKSIFSITIGMILSWFLAETFINTLTRLAKNAEVNLAYLKIMGPIMIRLQTALVMGIVLSLPFIFYFIWSFVSPGLYKYEKKWILPMIIGVTICFFIGASIAYFLIIPFMLKFIVGFMVADVEGRFDISDFIAWMLKFTVFLGIIFEMPMVAFVLAKIGILKHTWMLQYRKYAIVLIFLAGAILSPPDPLSQIMMAIPLILLYEISIQVARIAGRKTIL